jgi:hypothetical protein
MSWCSKNGLPHSEFLGWEPSDRAKLMAFLLEEAKRCVKCGTAQWEWDLNRFAYHAASHHCQGCLHLEAAAEGENERMLGSTIVLIPNK